LVLLGVGWLLYRRKRPGFLCLALASTGHLVLDRMWEMPRILFWPLYGLAFPAEGEPGAAQVPLWWHMLLADPWVYVPEMIGGLILLYFVFRL